MDHGEFKKCFKKNFSHYIRKEIHYREARSWWEDCFRTLKWQVFNTFEEEVLREWKKLRITFEMVLPNQQRPDVLIFTSTMIIVLEFKRHKNEYLGHMKEVNAYCRKIQKWSEVCKGRKVRGIVVYTRLKDYEYQRARTRMCSSDLLAEKLRYLQPNSQA